MGGQREKTGSGWGLVSEGPLIWGVGRAPHGDEEQGRRLTGARSSRFILVSILGLPCGNLSESCANGGTCLSLSQGQGTCR